MPSAKSKAHRSVDGYRKHSLPSEKLPPQPTIVEHFAHSKQGIRDTSVDASAVCIPNKRVKLLHKPQVPSEPETGLPQVRFISDMYNFSSSNPRHTSTVIDLTTSPNENSIEPTSNGIAQSAGFTPSTGPRKLVVKNQKRPSRPNPEQYYRNVWEKLDVSLAAIFFNESLPHSKETLYNEVMIICRQAKAAALVTALGDKFTNHIEQHIKVYLQRAAASSSDADVLTSVVTAWESWMKSLESVRAIFFFLDRSYILQQGLPSVKEMGAQRFTSVVLEDQSLQPKISQGACNLIQTERSQQSNLDTRTILQQAISMFAQLGLYSDRLEPKILSESQDFYATWAKQTTASTDLAGYVEMCDNLIQRELACAHFWALDPATTKLLETYLEDILIEGNQSRLLNAEDVGELLSRNRTASLYQTYTLLQRRRLGGELKVAFENHIVTEGSGIVFDEAHEEEMVSRLLEFKSKLHHIWEDAFRRNVHLGHTLRESFETFINRSKRSSMTWGTDNPKPGEMIAKYVDRVLKGGAKAIRASGITDNVDLKTLDADQEAFDEDEDVEIGKQLDQVLDLFRFVHGKAVFEAFYKRDLARRLLLGRSASSDAEKSMLTRLKSECGAGFTHNLEQMFKDIEMAREEIMSYKALLEERGDRPSFDLNVNVLSSAAWPSYPSIRVNVPEAILKATSNFEYYYKLKHSGRKLEWKHALAHCQLRSSFPKGTKEIVVSSFQAIILLAFNGVDSLTYSELQACTGLDDLELKRTLQSLACAKYRVLSKNPRGKEVNTNDTFGVNLGFCDAKYRIKINQIQARETKQENQQTHERIAADRAFEAQAAIVRIMKGRKTISHPELVSEVISATKSRGPLDPADIKKNIEKLIEKDYMERDEDAHNTYSYVA